MHQIDDMKRSDKVQMIISKQLPFIWQHGTLLIIIALSIIFILLYYVPYTQKYSYKIKIDTESINQYRFSSIDNIPLPRLYSGQRIHIVGSGNSKLDYDLYIENIKYIDTCLLEVIVTTKTQDFGIKPQIYDIIIPNIEEPILRKVFGRR